MSVTCILFWLLLYMKINKYIVQNQVIDIELEKIWGTRIYDNLFTCNRHFIITFIVYV